MSEALADLMNGQQRHYLDAMGIQVWALREGVQPRDKIQGERARESVDQSSTALEPLTSKPVPVNIATLDWDALQQRVQGCTRCPGLASSHCRTVFGSGNRDVDWLVIGETPGGDQNEPPEPFSGQTSQLLNAMFAAIGLRREQTYLTTALKCLPPGNREPEVEEITACADYLLRQIELLQPKIILAAGRVAAQSLLGTDAALDTLRGKVHRLTSGVPVVVTCSPTALLRSPQDKRKAWADLCLAHATLLAVNEPKG